MLLRNKHSLIIWTLLSALAFSPKAGAGLYGHTSANPETYAETFLNQETPPLHIINYREKMRENLLMMINYAQAHNADFQILVHEGEELLTKSFWEYNLDDYNRVRKSKKTVYDDTFLSTPEELPAPPMETLAYQYLHSIGGIALNNIYCGKNNKKNNKLIQENNIPVIGIEKCNKEEDFDRAIIRSVMDGRIVYGYSDPQYAFKDIAHQPVINESAKNVTKFSEAKNILILNDDQLYQNKNQLVDALADTNYDVIVIKPLFRHNQPFSNEDIHRLKFKKNGTRRLLIAEMNVSEINPYDYFWKKAWKQNPPQWFKRKSFVEADSIITEYWNTAWQEIISKHFKDIIRSDFDGVFFTGIENYKYFEKQTPIE